MEKNNDVFIPASRIARTANYRNAKGERIGMPPTGIVEDDPGEFEITLTAGMSREEPDGPMSGIGQHFLQQNMITEAEIYRPAEIAQMDREEESGRGAGTPGRGVPLEDPYGYEVDVGVRKANRTAIMRRQLTYYIQQAERCLDEAQLAENRGNREAARVFDAKAEKYANQADSLESQIGMREDHLTRVR